MLATHTTAAAESDLAAPSPNLPASWRQIVAPVQPFLRSVARRLAEQVELFEPEIVGHARYALSSQGKQFRPALVGLSAEAAGRLNDDHVTVATIIEMVHLATLVHDDIMDSAEVRRRRPTLAVQAGASTSVLLGDCLFAHALTLASSFPTSDICRAVAGATKIVCTGEIIQTEQACDLSLSREAYFRILRMKTAELFALSCDLGARLSGANLDDQQALRDYGMALGTAYQIYDDCVDLFGTESKAGKSLGTDLLGGKVTLPLIVALERVGDARRPQVEALLRGWQAENRVELLALLRETGALEEAARVTHGFCEDARRALGALTPTAGRRALLAATDFLAQQTEALRSNAAG